MALTGGPVPLTTVFTPHSSCTGRWTYYSQYNSYSADTTFLTSIVSSNYDCQASQYHSRVTFSPGVCYGNLKIADYLTTSENGSGGSITGFVVGADVAICFSYVTAPTVVSSLDITYRSSSSTTYTFGTTVSTIGAEHSAIRVEWQESDLAAFPSAVSEQLKLTMGAYLAKQKVLATFTVTSAFRGYTTRAYVSVLPVSTPSSSSTTTATDGTSTPGSGIHPTAQPPSSELSAGAIAGISIGAVIALVGIGLLVWFCFRQRRQRMCPQYPTSATGVVPGGPYHNGANTIDEKGYGGGGQVQVEGRELAMPGYAPAPVHTLGSWELGEAPVRVPELYAENSSARKADTSLDARYETPSPTQVGSSPGAGATTSWGAPSSARASSSLPGQAGVVAFNNAVGYPSWTPTSDRRTSRPTQVSSPGQPMDFTHNAAWGPSPEELQLQQLEQAERELAEKKRELELRQLEAAERELAEKKRMLLERRVGGG
ncbi:hypothetical protein QBC35DRAFT_451608 [Podospora australis]|uniref:Uncharacterized protein n=1 Tax=Podospora australis TaxID=1536484 RepID=A0AAN7AJD3_9PEZI|nr:hypothetical protein QBC35DRAFT_451608 [Podospora australis]